MNNKFSDGFHHLPFYLGIAKPYLFRMVPALTLRSTYEFFMLQKHQVLFKCSVSLSYQLGESAGAYFDLLDYMLSWTLCANYLESATIA